MLQTIRNAWRLDDIRKKLLFLFFIVFLYRLGNAVTVPYIDTALLSSYFTSRGNTILGLLNTMSGSALERASIFAMSIQPYINASIIIQLLTIAIPALERLQKDGGEEGKNKLERITRYSTVAIALLQGYGYYVIISSNGFLNPEAALTAWAPLVIIGSFMAGSTLLMWMGEQITEFGVGNGISVILFISIVSRFPSQVANIFSDIGTNPGKWWIYVLMLIGALAIMVLIVVVTSAERRIPIHYAKKVVGRKSYGGQTTHLPIKVNMSGVLPIIFAQSMASIPATIAAFVPKWQDAAFIKAFDTTSWIYIILYFALIVFFSYFYSTIQFNPIEVAKNLQKNSGVIPGIRPGRPTSEFIQRVLTKITLFGAIYLAIIAIVPIIISKFSATAASSGISLGGTSIIIVISVALETIKQLEVHTMQRGYKGFLE
ncbi:MAG: preprotein translocase subunit SecY [Oscillospiraceae bacterium]|nr:preprotein translocase subunit SecY [Oscillospiraceae bacterium]